MGIHWSFQKSGVKIKMMFMGAATEAMKLDTSGEILGYQGDNGNGKEGKRRNQVEEEAFPW